jgi:hypothetical protein
LHSFPTAYKINQLTIIYNKLIFIIMEKIGEKLFCKLNRKAMTALKGVGTTRPTQYTYGTTGWTVYDREYFVNNGKFVRREIIDMSPQPIQNNAMASIMI